MNRYIGTDKLHNDLTKIRINLMQKGVDVTPIWQALDCVSQQPPADVRENVKGEWIKHYIHHGSISWGHDCSICGHWFVIGEEKIKDYNFCPNCGADMRTPILERI